MIRSKSLFYIFIIIIFEFFLYSCASAPKKAALEEGKQAETDANAETDEHGNIIVKKAAELPNFDQFAKVETIDSIENINKEQDKRILKLEKENKTLSFQVTDLIQDNRVSKKMITQLRNDVFSLSEVISTNRREIEIIKRGLRSGIFEDLNPANKSPSSATGQSMLPDILESRYSFEERQNSITPESPKTEMNQPTAHSLSPSQMLANAEIKIQQAQFGEAIVTIEDMKKNFPNYDDGGKSYILAAEAWFKMREYNNTFNELKSFYLKYPASSELSHAKLIEGKAYEKMDQKNKATDLYQEVITLAPQSNDAQNAREGMLRMRDAK
ncbi:tetratricopeptide repeat protein [Fluviispira multicolorata]|uniref:Outer membrane protein assembly factor BamD n=1 Tax=Fluviispira multicolorata TaxID=2654512 RepID=A0A833N6H5_9BACT|nr:outer membrane protein assembly factor BamD [Fluviispira multicolorata]KAB8030003.1 outer membrane protein assembly factor BamD [Fluviispira multicolorata]